MPQGVDTSPSLPCSSFTETGNLVWERARACCQAMSGGAGEMIAGAVVKQIAGKLVDLAMGEASLQWKFKDDVVKMTGKMQDLEAVMRDADNRCRRGGSDGEAVGRWVTKFKSAAYDTEDMLDELDANELIKKTQPKVLLHHTTVLIRDKILSSFNTLASGPGSWSDRSGLPASTTSSSFLWVKY